MASTFNFELKVIGAKNIDTKQKGNLFIRCYLPTGINNRKIQLNTKEIISSQKDNDNYIFWDDSFSLECNGTEDSVLDLKQESVFFELRWKNTKTFLGKVGGSKLISTAEMPLKSVFEAPKMEVHRWVFMGVDQEGGSKLLKVEEGGKPPALQLAMKIVEVEEREVSVDEMRKMRRRERLRRWDECGCRVEGGCCSTCVDNELLLIGVAFDDF